MKMYYDYSSNFCIQSLIITGKPKQNIIDKKSSIKSTIGKFITPMTQSANSNTTHVHLT